MTPTELSVTLDARHLIVDWPDGTADQLAAEMLRREARDAVTRRDIIDHGTITVAPDLTITGLNPVGRGAVNITFSDGHDRAIYPFAFLKTLSERFGN